MALSKLFEKFGFRKNRGTSHTMTVIRNLNQLFESIEKTCCSVIFARSAKITLQHIVLRIFRIADTMMLYLMELLERKNLSEEKMI